MALGEELRRHRLEQGLSLTELARRAQVSKGYLSQLEHSQEASHPSADILYRIAFALGVSVGELLGKQLAHTVEEITDIPPALREFARLVHLSDDDIRMLAPIRYRGEQPKTVDDWRFIYESIRRAILTGQEHQHEE